MPMVIIGVILPEPLAGAPSGKTYEFTERVTLVEDEDHAYVVNTILDRYGWAAAADDPGKACDQWGKTHWEEQVDGAWVCRRCGVTLVKNFDGHWTTKPTLG